MDRHPKLQDGLGMVIFVVGVVIGTLLLNTFVFQTFNVEGASMETTMYTGDRLIVNRLPVTGSKLQNKNYITVYNTENPDGFNPDTSVNKNEPGQPTSGDVDTTVPEGTIFVMGDHRQGSYSCDSRNCMGPIPLYDIVGPVSLRIFPFNKIRSF